VEAPLTLFLATFATLVAIINPLEALPIYLGLVDGKDDKERLRIAIRACLYALALMFFFLLFGSILLRVFGVPLPMARIAGGIILTRLGFSLFSSPTPTPRSNPDAPAGGEDVAFVPLAMPIMFGPGAMATLMGMTSMIRRSSAELMAFAEVALAILATMAVTFLVLVAAKRIQRRIGPRGVDAATRIVGFFVSAIGVGIVFHGTVEALQTYGLAVRH
jgi:multiple antibiotic resistance protein